jgi:hypothetical protein
MSADTLLILFSFEEGTLPPISNLRITEDSNFRITEDGDTRVTE